MGTHSTGVELAATVVVNLVIWPEIAILIKMLVIIATRRDIWPVIVRRKVSATAAVNLAI